MNVELWFKSDRIYINSDFDECVTKIANIDNRLFFLTLSQNLYHGPVQECNGQLQLQLTQVPEIKFKDIDSWGKYLYAVDSEGSVYKYKDNLELLHEIILSNESKVCIHGHSSTKIKLKVIKIAVGEFGCLYVTDNGQLWASGNMSQIGINSNNPKRVNFFENRYTQSINVGSDFAIVIVSKQFTSEDTDSDNSDEDVFAPTCPHCMSISPNTLNVKENCDSSSTTSSKNDTVSTASLDHNRLINSCEFTESSESEKISKNIIFRNTEAAKDFLTRQFSWMSSAGEEYLAECTEKPTRIIKENVTNMASFVYEGVKTVGDKVVTLSRHVSGSSDNCDVLEMAEDVSLPRITSKDEFMWSLSQGTSEKDCSEQGLQERCNAIIKNGSNLLNCEVWTWGNVAHGQLGLCNYYIYRYLL